MNWRRWIWGVLAVETGLLGVTLLSLFLWLLLAGLGDEAGASAARIIAVAAGGIMLAVQILLVHLLALGTLRMKMDGGNRPPVG